MRILIQGNVLLAALLFLLCMLIIVLNHVCLHVQVQQCLIELSPILQQDHALRNVLWDIWQILTNLFVLQAALLFLSYSFSMRYQDHVYKYALKDGLIAIDGYRTCVVNCTNDQYADPISRLCVSFCKLNNGYYGMVNTSRCVL